MTGGLPRKLRNRLDPGPRYGLRLALVAFASVLVAAPFVTVLVQVLAKGPLTSVDGALADG